jgi:6-phosphofructokinase 2
MCPPIATLTLNPAMDLACSAAAVRPTHKIRTVAERFDPGGGGVNIARVVHALGGDALALIMTGGVTGRLVEELLDEAGVRWKPLPIHGRTRITLNVHDLQSTVGTARVHRAEIERLYREPCAGTEPIRSLGT